MQLPDHIKQIFKTATCLYTRVEVETALDHMAHGINIELADLNPIVLCTVVGGIVPLGNLLPRMDFPLEVDYLHVTRYRGSTTGSHIVWLTKPQKDLKDRTILIVDDILDVGLTLKAIVDFCSEVGAKRVYTAVLVDKVEARNSEGLLQADFRGLIVPNRYVFGYGMDYKEYLRNAPGIYAVATEYE